MRIISLLTALAATFKAARVRRATTRELAAMSVCELSDISITRLDVSSLFEPRPMSEFRSRCGAGPQLLCGRGDSSRLMPGGEKHAARTRAPTSLSLRGA
jgi:uncharacterized protein YjiS (DUF1127 family)